MCGKSFTGANVFICKLLKLKLGKCAADGKAAADSAISISHFVCVCVAMYKNRVNTKCDTKNRRSESF